VAAPRSRIVFSALPVAKDVFVTAPAQEGGQIRIRRGDHAITARLNDSEAARDFASMLPLTNQMDDHLRREKTGIIPRPLSERTPGNRTYELGDLEYWRPRNTFVIFYRQDGLTIPGPGIVLLGKVDSGVEIFDLPGRRRPSEGFLSFSASCVCNFCNCRGDTVRKRPLTYRRHKTRPIQ
jgi:hypothetical protein